MDMKVTKRMALQEQSTAESAKLSQLSAKHVTLTNELGRVKSQSVTGDIVPGNLKLLSGARERPVERVKGRRRREKFSLTPFTAES